MWLPVPVPGPGAPATKFGFDRDGVVGKPALDELALGEMRQRDVAVDRVRPGAAPAVMRHHERHRGAGGAAVAVAAMRHGGPGDGLAQAVLADPALAQQLGLGAHEAVIVQRLDHGDAAPPGRLVGGGRDQRERVVAMHDVGPLAGDQAVEVGEGVAVADRAGEQFGRAHRGDLVVVTPVAHDLVAVRLQERALVLEDPVLAAGPLIGVVAQQDLHARPRKAPSETGGPTRRVNMTIW